MRQNLSSARRPGPVGEHGHQLSAHLLGLNRSSGRVGTARSGLGITAGGDLVWAAGEQLTPALARAGARSAPSAVRAVQLDINGFWVAGYLYVHRPSGPVATPVVPGQDGIAGQLRLPYSRDFFTVVSR